MTTQLQGPMQAQLEAKGLVKPKTQQQRIWEWLKDHPLSTSAHAEAIFGKNTSSLLNQMEQRKMVFSFKERRQAKNHVSKVIKVYKCALPTYELLPFPAAVKQRRLERQQDRRLKLKPGLNDVGTGHILQPPVPPLAQAALAAAAADPAPSPAAPPATSLDVLEAQLAEVNRKLDAATEGEAIRTAPASEPVPLTLANMTMDQRIDAILDGLSIKEGRMLLDRLKELFG